MNKPSQVLVVNYTLLCLSALLIMLLALIEYLVWSSSWAVYPFAIGALGVVFRWRAGVGLTLLSLAAVILGDSVWAMMRGAWRPESVLHPTNLIICGAVLTFVVGQLRLLSLTRDIVPRDPREEVLRRWDETTASPVARPPQPPRHRLGVDASAGAEFLGLLLTLPLWLLVGGLLSITLLEQQPPLPLNSELWRLIIFIWVVALVLVTAWVGFAQWRYRTMSPVEALLFLQDEQWRETRAEQRLMGRWLCWARQRRRRKEQS